MDRHLTLQLPIFLIDVNATLWSLRCVEIGGFILNISERDRPFDQIEDPASPLHLLF
jgi:hypothetical protein